VIRTEFTDATLILLGHGTTRNEDSSAPVFQHAAELRRRRIFAAVREAFWKQEPSVGRVLAEVTTPRAFIVPLFISEGYFSEEVIPRELGFKLTDHPGSRITRRGSRVMYYCNAIGTHASMTDVLLARAREVVTQFPFPCAPKPAGTTLFIAGHGTERNENSRKAIERQVELIRTRNVYAATHAVFLEESPRIGDCGTLARTRNLVVVPFFISDGLHCTEDIPVLLGESERVVKARLAAGQPTWRNPTEMHRKLTWLSPAVGSHPRIAGVILDRVCEAAGAAACAAT